jgi:large subunit ribosomal protein L21
MYAVIRSCGRQYHAEPGKVLKLEKLPGAIGEEVTMGEVVLLADGEQVEIGRPLLDGVTVRGRIIEQGRSRKILIFKHKRRKDYRKKQGHRQSFTAVMVEGIDR